MTRHFGDWLVGYYRSWIPEREEGQGMAEYGLILAGVAVLAIVAVFLLGGKLGTLLNRISGSLS